MAYAVSSEENPAAVITLDGSTKSTVDGWLGL